MLTTKESREDVRIIWSGRSKRGKGGKRNLLVMPEFLKKDVP